MVTESGKKIPLDVDTDEPHDCPVWRSSRSRQDQDQEQQNQNLQCRACGKDITFSDTEVSKSGGHGNDDDDGTTANLKLKLKISNPERFPSKAFLKEQFRFGTFVNYSSTNDDNEDDHNIWVCSYCGLRADRHFIKNHIPTCPKNKDKKEDKEDNQNNKEDEGTTAK